MYQLFCPIIIITILTKTILQNHITSTCEDIPSDIFRTEEPRDVGSVPVNVVHGLLPPSEEDWDAVSLIKFIIFKISLEDLSLNIIWEQDPVPASTYDAIKASENKLVLRSKIGLSKKKKKEWRNQERKRFQALEEKGPIMTRATPLNVSVVYHTIHIFFFFFITCTISIVFQAYDAGLKLLLFYSLEGTYKITKIFIKFYNLILSQVSYY